MCRREVREGSRAGVGVAFDGNLGAGVLDFVTVLGGVFTGESNRTERFARQ